MVNNSKHILKMYSTSWANTHHDVTDFEIDGMVKNINNQILQEQNMTLPWN